MNFKCFFGNENISTSNFLAFVSVRYPTPRLNLFFKFDRYLRIKGLFEIQIYDAHKFGIYRKYTNIIGDA